MSESRCEDTVDRVRILVPLVRESATYWMCALSNVPINVLLQYKDQSTQRSTLISRVCCAVINWLNMYY